MATKAYEYAVHEASHAIVAWLCGFPVKRIRIDVENNRGATDPERGFDPDEACYYVRNHSADDRTRSLLPRMKRDLAGRLAGTIGDEVYGIVGSEAEYKRDRAAAKELSTAITLASWKLADPRPPLSDREPEGVYIRRMNDFVRGKLLDPHRSAIEALAAEIERKGDLSESEIRDFFASRSVSFGSVRDDELP